jgi:predicted O-linked N-acetylglucosamine transferase (SPINDLY family)
MNFASLNYDDEPLDMFGQGSAIINTNSDPVCIANNLTEESIQFRDTLLNILNNKDILPIDDQEFKCEEIDTIVNQIKSFNTEFMNLQDDLEEYHQKYQEEVKKTKENIDKIDCSIQFIKTCNKEYESNEKIKSIVDSLTEYIKTINENDKLKSAKEEYINKRKLINKHLCLINAVNKLNIAAICPICLTDKIDSYCNPCGHTACKKCLDKTSSIVNNVNHNKCPICREYVMDIRKLYFI